MHLGIFYFVRKVNASLFNILFSDIVVYDVGSPDPFGGPLVRNPSANLYAFDSLAAAQNGLVATNSSGIALTGKMRFALFCCNAHHILYWQFSKVYLD